MTRTRIKLGAAASVFLFAGAASAGVVTATFSYDHHVRVNVASEPLTGNVSTVTFHWTRQDVPGPGVDSTLSPQFITFCVELDQNVRSGNEYTYDAVTPAQAGYSPEQEVAMQTLWAEHIDEIGSDNGSSAFQLAVWELRYDTDRNLTTGAFVASSPSASVALAQAWLSALSSSSTLRDLPSLVVLQNDDAQDQLTAMIPEPGAVACMFAGMAMLRRRRRR